MQEDKKVDRKKYWLKLNKDFLKSPQMKVIKAMPNGKDYIIFYLSLMLESVETVGHLRFTSLIPYNAEMLAAITETNIDIVRSATKIFCELGLMQIFDDGTIFIPKVPEITGKESDSAERVRDYRARIKAKEKEKMLQCNDEVTKSNSYIDKDIEEEKEKEEEKQQEEQEEKKDKSKPKKTKFVKPTYDDVERYAFEKGYHNVDIEYFINYYESNGWCVGRSPMKNWKAAFSNWVKRSFENNKKKDASRFY